MFCISADMFVHLCCIFCCHCCLPLALAPRPGFSLSKEPAMRPNAVLPVTCPHDESIDMY